MRCLLAALLLLPLAARSADAEAVRKAREEALAAQFSLLARESPKADEGRRRALFEEEGRDPLHATPEFLKKLHDLLSQSLKRLEGLEGAEAVRKEAAESRPVLDAARRAALALIFDRKAYPDASPGKAGQDLVDQAVARVRAVYAPGASTAGKALAPCVELRRALESLGEKDLPELPDREPLARRIDEAWSRAWTPSEDLKRLDLVREALKDADPEVVSCFETTNRYRLLMGLNALLVEPRIMSGSQKYSEDMKARNFFSHSNPEGLHAPERLKAEGYTGAGMENLARGAPTGEAAVQDWTHESGHHRALLMPGWTVMGIGRSGTLWAQNFGSASPKRP